MNFFKKKYPDMLLLVSNLAVLFLSGGEARVFLITIVLAITLRYVLLSVLIFLDWRRPGWFAGSRLRRLTRDPAEGGAYRDGAGSSLVGHFIFMVLFNFIPLLWIMGLFKAVPLAGGIPYIIWTALAVELREIATGRVVYFRSGAGQSLNASWNFKLSLALACTLILLPGVCLLGGVAVVILDPLFNLSGWRLPLDFFTPGAFLWLLSIWFMVVFHGLLFLDDRKAVTKNSKSSGSDRGNLLCGGDFWG